MSYVKLINNVLEYAPQNKGAIINYNTNVELMTADGYKLLVEVERPETNRKYHIGYNETDTEMQEQIVYDETQAEADAREAQEEATRISNLTLTGADVERAIYEAKDMNFDDLIEYVVNSGITGFDVKRLGIELKANNFVRKHPYINIVGQILGYTSADMDYLFIHKQLPEEEGSDS